MKIFNVKTIVFDNLTVTTLLLCFFSMQCRPVIFWENGFCQYFTDTNDMNLEPNEGQEKNSVT